MLISVSFVSGYIVSEHLKKSLESSGFIVVDDLGRIVQIPDVERVVSLASSATETLYGLGAGDKVVGVDAWSNYPPEVKDKPCIGSGSAPNIEMIIGLEPDVLFAWPYSRNAIVSLEGKMAVVYIDPKSVDDVLDTIKLIGLITGKTSEAENLTLVMQNKIDEITDITSHLNKTERPLVYYELSTPMKTCGPGTFTNELIFMAGGINLAADEPIRYPLLSSEYIIDRNPDVIVVISYGVEIEEIKNRGGWQEINAVKNDRVYKIDTNWVTSNPRVVLGLEQFAEWFHPDLFR